ncbi:diacylglycerol kinase family protein [Candidatus Nomurabacteria bacterium]|jgi:diacylglycerol kinase (ATP)|nr:MAG: diacylglycerol kinase family protein [Candidatus Nomurabacteria bacterium]
MESYEKDKQAFTISGRIRSMRHACRGLLIFIKNEHNAWLHIVALIAVVMLGMYFSISSIEWLFIILAVGIVFVAEAFNTALEIDMNLTSPEFNPKARDTKDIAAGAVLITSLAALLIGLIIFIPKILWCFK